MLDKNDAARILWTLLQKIILFIKKFLFDRKKIKLCQWCAHRWTLKDSYDTWDPYCPVSSMHLARDQKTLKCYWWRLWSNPLIDIFNILHHHIKFINPLQPSDSKQKFHKISPFPSNTIYKKIPPTKTEKHTASWYALNAY